MQCADEIREYLDGKKSLTSSELHKLLSRYFDRQFKCVSNVLTPEEIDFIQSVYLDSSFEQ